MHAAEPIAKLRKLLQVAEAGELGALGRWLTPRLRDYLMRASEGATLDKALGLAVRPGETPWWAVEAAGRRNNAIRALADRLPDTNPTAQAEEIAKLGRRYVASSWRFDREKTEIPERYLGTEKELLFRALKATARKFPGARQIRAILSG